MLTKKPYIIRVGDTPLGDDGVYRLHAYIDDWMHEVIQKHEAIITTVQLFRVHYFIDPRYDAQEVINDLSRQLDLALAVNRAMEEIEPDDSN